MFGLLPSIPWGSTQTELVTIMGYAVAMLVALLLVSLGVRMLIKWSHAGIRAQHFAENGWDSDGNDL